MTTTEHIAGKELMALADGELHGAELHTVEEHVAACAVCAQELASLRAGSGELKSWPVEAVPAGLERAVLGRVRAWGEGGAVPQNRGWLGWRMGLGAGALVALTILVMVAGMRTNGKHFARKDEMLASHDEKAPLGEPERDRAVSEVAGKAEQAPPSAKMVGMSAGPPPPPPPPSPMVAAKPEMKMRAGGVDARQPLALDAPMIARTVALELRVQSVARAREGLDGLLRAYGGYAATMEETTPEDGTATLHASLRVPAGQMRGLLAELKGYGKVERETQSGEEVGQQHADLAARLNVARESETRLRSILKTRTGAVADVLEVEEEIARVRGEIESMEAEQQGLEHRVSYSTVELTFSEQDGGRAAGPTAWSRIAAALREGGDNALSALLFLLEYGLAALLVLVPAWLGWRRWRRVSGRW